MSGSEDPRDSRPGDADEPEAPRGVLGAEATPELGPEDEVLEDEGAEAAEPSGELEDVRSKLAATEERCGGLYDQLVRLKADFENFRKRTDREKPGLIRHGKRELLERMVPLYDVLFAAHEHIAHHADLAKSASKGKDPGPVSELVRGLEMIFSEFTKLFEAEGVSVIEAVGQPYDFDKHEVLGQTETDEFPEGTVVEELQRGYMLEGKTLRAAKVRIAKKK